MHENASGSAQYSQKQASVSHFGHHQPAKTCIDEIKAHAEDLLAFAEDDHHDHLPSYAQLILNEADESYLQPLSAEVIQKFEIDWSNLYQSPDLGLNSPPPMPSPLLAG